MHVSDMPTILIVDDSPSNIHVLAQILKNDYNIRIATSGSSALELIHSDCNLDCILLDIVMPEMNGYKVCQILKKNADTKDIPIIFISGKDQIKDEEYGLNIGAVDYITKPFHSAIVKSRVKTQVSLKIKTDLLKQMALRDQLTQLYNRYYLVDIAPQKIKQARRQNYSLSLLVIDIDHFKEVNDSHGHKSGDNVLCSVAHTLRSCCRTEDMVARYGGEEFVVILENCNGEQAQEKAELIRRGVEKSLPENIPVTISIGISELNEFNQDFVSLFKQADSALYQAKKNGRNQVVSYVLS